MSGSASTGRRHTGAELSSQRVAAILGAAEEAAVRIRAEAETRMQDRIKEGARAANARVAAAEEEAREILAAAKSEAEAERSRGASEALATIGAAEEDATRTRLEAERDAREVLDQASAQAREMLGQARMAADAARTEGQELTGHLQELSSSLRANAERLMRDIRHTHDALTAGLNAVDTGSPPARGATRGDGGSRRSAPVDESYDVPEFIPRR